MIERMSEYIEIKNLKRIYKPGKDVLVKALNGLSFSVKEGEIISLVGSSGSGKSTFLNVLGGLDWKYTGEISVDGKNIREYNPNFYRRFVVGTIFQQFYLIPSLTVEENILLPTRFKRNMKKEQLRERLNSILKSIDMEDRVRHYPNELSGGQAQRVAIARAIIDEPKIVLADEPTGNLDSKTGKAIIDLLKSLSEKEGITTIVVTHDMNIAKETERKITLVDGRNV
jgi:putative ABC transport system ATP-binding protein